MSQRDLRQVGFADGLIKQRSGRNEALDQIEAMIDWSAIGRLLSAVYSSREGRPAYPILSLVRLLLLQQWYGLSDPALEQAVDDRLSFRRFAGLPLDAGVPDHSTIWRFRQELAARQLDGALFEEIERQLAARRLLIRRGTLIDASIVAAAVKPPPIRAGTVSARDPDAGWTTKNAESTFGYKAHLAVDEGSGLIRAAILTTASVHDSQAAPGLIRGDEAAVYGDKAYGSAALRHPGVRRGAAGIEDGLMYKRQRNTPLKSWQKWFNKTVAPIRAAVERAFATLKCRYGWRRARYLGLVRNACHLRLLCIAANIRRALVLSG